MFLNFSQFEPQMFLSRSYNFRHFRPIFSILSKKKLHIYTFLHISGIKRVWQVPIVDPNGFFLDFPQKIPVTEPRHVLSMFLFFNKI